MIYLSSNIMPSIYFSTEPGNPALCSTTTKERVAIRIDNQRRVAILIVKYVSNIDGNNDTHRCYTYNK